MKKSSQNIYKYNINSWVYVARNSLNYLLHKSLYPLLSAEKSVFVANYSPGLSTGAKPASLNLLSPLATLHEKMKVSGNINRFTLHEFGFWQHKPTLQISFWQHKLILEKFNCPRGSQLCWRRGPQTPLKFSGNHATFRNRIHNHLYSIYITILPYLFTTFLRNSQKLFNTFNHFYDKIISYISPENKMVKNSTINNINNSPAPPESWHTLTKDELFSKLNSSDSGLSDSEVKERLEIYGPNMLPGYKPPTLIKIIISQFLNPLIYVLLLAAVVSIAIGDLKDSVFIFLVLLINAAIGSAQEWKAEKSSEALQKLLKIFVKVLRSGHEVELNSEGLVPGDILLLESGNKVPADARLIDINQFSVDESLLTGESFAIEKSLQLLKEDVELADKINMVFAGSVVTSGRARAIVVDTAIRTEIGKIARAITQVESSKPPLVIRMEKFSNIISVVILIACFVLAGIQLMRGMAFVDIFFIVVALAVSAIPEGLPAAMTVALSVGMSRMAKRNVIIKKLTAVESLGSCTLIASDKTGTLTVNKQTVKKIIAPDGTEFEIFGEGYSPDGDIIKDGTKIVSGQNNTLDEIIKSVTISNEAKLNLVSNEWISHGDAVDLAMLTLAYKAGYNYNEVNKDLKIVKDIPYESEKGYSARFFKYPDLNKIELATKGALEVIGPLCSRMLLKDQIVDIDREKISNLAEELASNGYRVIAVAKAEYEMLDNPDSITQEEIKDLIFLGLVGLIDPLRKESFDAVKECQNAGIKVIMITGDHPATALAIGRELGLAETENSIITGKELSNLSEDDLNMKIKNISIFARVTPLQKLDIITALTESGHYVAVTGDGANDAPALKKANISVAMGSGTDIAKDVSSMIIADNNFASIVAGIEEGRFTYDNVRKVIYLLVGCGLAELLLFTFALALNTPIPLIAVQLLWLNLVTNGIQGVGLAFESGEPETMLRPPREPGEGIFNKLMILEIFISGLTMALITFGVWIYLLHLEWSVDDARNVVLLTMVLLQNVQVFNARSEYKTTFKIPVRNNVLLVIGALMAQSLHIISMKIPIMQDTLSIGPVQPLVWLYLLGLAFLLLAVMEIFKAVYVKRLKQSGSDRVIIT